MFLILSVSVGSGLVGGFAFYWLWRRLVPRAWSVEFWRRLPGDVRTMVTCEDPTEMLRHYRALLVLMGQFALRNAAGVLLGVAPLAALFLLLAAVDPSASVASEYEMYPPDVARSVIASDVPGDASSDGPGSGRDERLLLDRADVGPVTASLAADAGVGQRADGKQAFCPSVWRCTLFETLLFRTHPLRREGVGASVVVRPAVLDRNPFWPYLNDLDFWFMVAAMIGSGAAALAGRRRAASP